MASPITIHATHPTPHFFPDSSTYSEEYQGQHLGEGAMGPYRAHPYQRERSQSPPKKGIDYRSTRLPHSAHPLQQVRPDSRDPSFMPFQRASHSHLSSPSRSTMYSSDSHRIGVDQLVDHHSDSRPSDSQHGPYYGAQAPASTSPFRGSSEQAESHRLPGIHSLLGRAPEPSRYDVGNRYSSSASQGSTYAPPRYHGHSAASSMSSAFSEPVSPSSYGGASSRSPVPQHPYPEDRNRAQSHYQYPPSREESQYDPGRAHTLGALPIHPQRSLGSPYPPPPPPSGPETMLPPPPEPFLPNPYHASRAPYPFTQPHPSQMGPSWDRPRFDSANSYYDPSMAPPNYPWPYGGSNAANSLARKRRGNLPKEATKILKDWFGKHHDSPYPTEDEKQELCRATGLQISQVNNWFINARRRLPREDAKKILDKEGADADDSGDSDIQNSLHYQ